MVRQARPDVDVRLLVENSDKTGEPHAAAMAPMLALPPDGWQIISAEGAFNRTRSFLSTFGQGPSSVSRSERPSNPVEPDWRKKSPKPFPTTMTT
eukprot:7795921-Alexandrium_andersonii.AAC.1